MSRLRRISLLALLGLMAGTFLCVTTGCGPDPLTRQQLAGLGLYHERCAHCHEDNDLALKKAPPDLRGIFGRATLPSGAPATDAEIRRVVLTGKGTMPAFAGRFTEEQMAALLAYLHTGVR
jgi:mono/diheme cytochrome c family protein